MFRKVLAPLVLVFIVAHASAAHARGFTANEEKAMRIMYNTIVEGLSKPGSTKLVWRQLVEGKNVSNEAKQAAATDINTIRSATNVLSYLNALFSTKRGNCGEHATVLHAGLMFMKHYMSNGTLFHSVRQYGFAPGDHVFVVVESADREQTAILDTWAEVFWILETDQFEHFRQMPYFASATWGMGQDTPNNPYLKPTSMIVPANNVDIWPALNATDDLRYTFLDVFPGMLEQFLAQ